MLKKVLVAAGIAGALGFIVAPASAATSVCYDVYADINGTVIDEEDCIEA